MTKEKSCYNCGTKITKAYCEDFPDVCEHWTPQKPLTNFERIKRMTVEEMAVLFAKAFAKLERTDQMMCSYRGIDVNKNIEWLESEVKE